MEEAEKEGEGRRCAREGEEDGGVKRKCKDLNETVASASAAFSYENFPFFRLDSAIFFFCF